MDFGIETCFIQGLDTFWKTCIQFLFLLHIWIIADAILVACHYSTRVTKLLGKNAVCVLSMLVLLSYVKIMGANVSIVSPESKHQDWCGYIGW